MLDVREQSSTLIHPFAYVHPRAEIGVDTEIGPFSYIGEHVKIGAGCKIHNNVTIKGHTTLGDNNEIYSNAVLGSNPQDLKFEGEICYLEIGNSNIIRENVTIHVGTQNGGSYTKIGHHNLFMACCHIAHDCHLGSHIVLSNNVLLGGHIHCEDSVVIGGSAALHHFVSIGEMAFIGGLSRIVQDVPPYMLVEGNPSRIRSYNRVALERKGLSHEDIQGIKEAHRLLFHSEIPQSHVIEELLQSGKLTRYTKHLIEFLQRSSSGKLGRSNDTRRYAKDSSDSSDSSK
jgi:UDP-N-acetylglucosamine acyltransferase